MKKIAILILSTVLMFCLNLASATTYKADVDQDYGFYRVVSTDKNQSVDYVNKTLIVNVGDNVIWINDATPDWPLTIMSEEGLWGNRSAYLRWNYQKFNYTFNKTGEYNFYIREFPRLQHQKIIVNDTGYEPTPISTITIPPTEEIPIITPVLTTVPKDTSTNVTPGFDIVMIMVTLLILYIWKKIE